MFSSGWCSVRVVPQSRHAACFEEEIMAPWLVTRSQERTVERLNLAHQRQFKGHSYVQFINTADAVPLRTDLMAKYRE